MSKYVVVIDIVARSDAEEKLVETFSGPFKEAISTQQGFQSVTLLKPVAGLDYLLVIAFSERSLQEQWVRTELHDEVWSAMEANFSSYQVRLFDTV